MSDAYLQREAEECADDERDERRLAIERRDRMFEKALIPGRYEREPAPHCGGCGAPVGSPCAAYCKTEHWS